jgi:CrcB protein
LRWGITVAFARLFGTSYPWGTLFINVSGSLFLGWLMAVLAERLPEDGWLRAADLRLMIAVGFTGAYTTFSTFEYETSQLIENGDALKSLSYVVGSVALGLFAIRFGMMLAGKS